MFFILLHYRSQLKGIKILFETGTGNKQRLINIGELAVELGPELCTTLMALHAHSGCDATSCLKGIEKSNQSKLCKKRWNSDLLSPSWEIIGWFLGIWSKSWMPSHVLYMGRIIMLRSLIYASLVLSPQEISTWVHFLRAVILSYNTLSAWIISLESRNGLTYKTHKATDGCMWIIDSSQCGKTIKCFPRS